MWMKMVNEDEYLYSYNEDEELTRLIDNDKELDETLMDMIISEFLDILFGKGKIKTMLNDLN